MISYIELLLVIFTVCVYESTAASTILQLISHVQQVKHCKQLSAWSSHLSILPTFLKVLKDKISLVCKII